MRRSGGSWIGRHWRGELSLAVSYWINGLLLTILLAIGFVIVGEASNLAFHPWTVFAVIVGAWTVAFTISVWQLVGIWRSASAHPSRGGARFWAVIAKILVCLGVVQVGAALFREAAPQIREAITIVSGDDEIGGFSLRRINDAEIEFSGGIRYGAATALSEALDAAPEIRVVHLLSNGGRIGEAEKMRDALRDRGVATYVSGHCESACSIAYLGGVERYIAATARIGFHGGSFPGLPPQDIAAHDRRVAREAAEFGVDPAAARRVFTSPAESMLFLDADELIAGGFATARADGRFGLSGLGQSPTRDDIADLLRANEPYTSIETRDPEAFARIVAIWVDGYRDGRSENAVTAETRALIGETVFRQLAQVSDESVLEVTALLLQQVAAVMEKDQLACHYFIFPDASHRFDPVLYFSTELQLREMAIMKRVLSEPPSETPPLSEERFNALFEALFSRMADDHGVDMLDRYDNWSDDPAAHRQESCEIALAFYGAAAALPQDEAAPLLRAIFTGG